MKRQKRNKLTRAHNKGFAAGIKGKSSDNCPFNSCDIREYWLSGWREARTALSNGYFV